jgi:hypothetical protein
VRTIADPILTPDDAEVIGPGHGTALDRISAFQTGFTDSQAACAAINFKTIEESRGDLLMVLTADDTGATQTGDAPANEQTLKTLIELLNTRFKPAQPPTLSLQPPKQQPCPDAEPTEPAAYCPATDTIAINTALHHLGQGDVPLPLILVGAGLR